MHIGRDIKPLQKSQFSLAKGPEREIPARQKIFRQQLFYSSQMPQQKTIVPYPPNLHQGRSMGSLDFRVQHSIKQGTSDTPHWDSIQENLIGSLDFQPNLEIRRHPQPSSWVNVKETY